MMKKKRGDHQHVPGAGHRRERAVQGAEGPTDRGGRARRDGRGAASPNQPAVHPAQRHAHAHSAGRRGRTGRRGSGTASTTSSASRPGERPSGSSRASGVTPATTMEIGCHLPRRAGGHPRRVAHVRPAGGEAPHRVAVGERSRHFPSLGHRQLSGGRFPHPPDKPYLEPVATLAAAAVITTHAASAPPCSSSGIVIRWSWPSCDGRSTRSPTAASSAASAWAGEGGAGDSRRALPQARPPGRRGDSSAQRIVDQRQANIFRRVLPLQRRRLRAQARPEAASADLGRRRQPGAFRRVVDLATAGTRRRRPPRSSARRSPACAPRRPGRATVRHHHALTALRPA